MLGKATVSWAAVFAAAAFCLVTTPASGQDNCDPIRWIDGTGLWCEPTNWHPEGVPHADDGVIIDKIGAFVELDCDAVVCSLENHGRVDLNDRTLTTLQRLTNHNEILADNGAARIVGGLTNAGVGVLGVAYGSDLTMVGSVSNAADALIVVNAGNSLKAGGEWTNDGLVNVRGSEYAAREAAFLLAIENMTLRGSGCLLLQSSYDIPEARAYLQTEDKDQEEVWITNLQPHTIAGSGWVEARLCNAGVIDASLVNECLYLTKYDITNAGTIKASNRGKLQVENIALDNTGGTLGAEWKSAFYITDKARIQGGEFSGNGAFFLEGEGKLENVTLALTEPGTVVVSEIGTLNELNIEAGAKLEVRYDATAYVSGIWTNEGEIHVKADADGPRSDAYFIVRENLTLTGHGQLQMSCGYDQACLQTEGQAWIVNAPDHTINGCGRIEACLVNQGSVEANHPGTTLYLVEGDKTNNSLMCAYDHAKLQLEQVELANAEGTLEAGRNSAVWIGRDGCVNGGLLTGRGVFECRGGKLVGVTLEPGTRLDVYDSDDRRDGVLDDVTVRANACVAVHSSPATRMSVSGTWTNDGQITVNCADQHVYACVEARADLDFTGSGILQFNSSAGGAYLDTTYGVTITNGADHTIENVTGWIDGKLVNRGTLTLGGGSILEIDGSALPNDPKALVMGPTAEYVYLLGLEPHGRTNVLGGETHLDGTLTLEPVSHLGNVCLGGWGDKTETIIAVDGLGRVVDPVTSLPTAALTTFANAPEPGDYLGKGVWLCDITYSDGGVDVSVFQAAAGDTNGDRCVDGGDIEAIMAANKFGRTEEQLRAEGAWPATWPEGDFTCDGLVTGSDIQCILAANLFGKPCPYATLDYTRPVETHVDVILTPDGVLVDTGGVTINGYMLTSQSGILTGEPAENLGLFQEDTDMRIGGNFGFLLAGSHWLGNVIGSEFADVDLLADLTFSYTVEGQAGIHLAHLVVPEPGTIVMLAGGLLVLLLLRQHGVSPLAASGASRSRKTPRP